MQKTSLWNFYTRGIHWWAKHNRKAKKFALNKSKALLFASISKQKPIILKILFAFQTKSIIFQATFKIFQQIYTNIILKRKSIFHFPQEHNFPSLLHRGKKMFCFIFLKSKIHLLCFLNKSKKLISFALLFPFFAKQYWIALCFMLQSKFMCLTLFFAFWLSKISNAFAHWWEHPYLNYVSKILPMS